MAASFEMKQNEMHIQNLEQKQKLNQAELSKERSFKLYLIIILLLAIVLTVIAYRSFLNKKKDNQALSIAYAEIETINKDISDSINYALNIQHARLPQKEKLKESFADCFVIYMPRDNVSGDFFWHNKNEDGKNVFAIADCTGHGIPGAFMSMMGIDGFNYAILEKRIDRPGEILTLVNRFIKDSLNQDHDAALSKDGMDVALCTFSADFSAVHYAGANRPLWINRNGEILEFKAQKLSIGGNHHGNYTFSDETISLQKGDLIYLFSDGYVDQFGGIKGKKFMSKQLKDALSKLSDLSCEQQEKELLRLFHEWKGNLAQVDDVVLVGIRV
jgi:serine phosphatase RsbU (regulator of sigma subunit)